MNTEDTIKKYATDKKIPCISVGIIGKDDPKEFHYGEIKKGSSIAPTSDTIYEIGSMTKTFTAILTVKLQEEGVLSLDDPIIKFLPDFVGSDFEKNNITLYHLITHTSGIVEVPLRDYPKHILSMIFRTGNGKVFPPRYSYATSEFLQETSKIKLKGNPGITTRYSNTSVGLVGKILERITDSTYEDLIKNYICHKLGMSDTGITLLEQHKDKLATGYMYTGKEADPISIPAVMSAGSIRSNISDILKFLKTNLGLQNEHDLSPVLQYCTSSLIEPKMNPILKRILPKPNGLKSMKIGLGWVVSDYGDDVKFVWHNGGTEGFSTAMAINPVKKTGCVVLTNKAFVDTYKFGARLLKTI
ncbi:MAG: serine hydrolase domain-containing protein [Nitrosopumilus sp.]